MSAGVSVGSASRPFPGQVANGDQIAIAAHGTSLTIAVADGLGHGPSAAAAAMSAVECVRRAPLRELGDLMRSCHDELRGTRGAALTILRIDGDGARVSHVAVGNVEVKSLGRSPFRGIPIPGVVGGRLRGVVVTQGALAPGDLLVIHTDGVSADLTLEPFRDLAAQRAAEAILARYAKESDDAACVVVRR